MLKTTPDLKKASTVSISIAWNTSLAFTSPSWSVPSLFTGEISDCSWFAGCWEGGGTASGERPISSDVLKGSSALAGSTTRDDDDFGDFGGARGLLDRVAFGVLNLSMVRPLWRWASRAALLKFSPLKVWPLSPLSLSISSRASLSLFLTYEGRQRARGGLMMIAQLARRDQGGGLALLCTLT